MSLLAVTYLVCIVLVWLAFVLPWPAALKLGVMALPWTAFELEIGVSVLVCQMVALALLLRAMFSRRGALAWPSEMNWLVAFVLWTLAAAMITLTFSDAGEVLSGGDPLRNGYGRVISQLAVLVLTFALPCLILVEWRGQDSAGVAAAYIHSCVALVALGYLQILVSLATGVDILPIGAFSNLGEDTFRSGMMGPSSGLLLRMTSLGGEPKGLAVSLVLALVALAGFWKSLPHTRAWKLAVLLALLGGVILTGSTSGFYGLAIFLAIWLPLSLRRTPLSRGGVTLLAAALSLGGFLLYLHQGAGYDWHGQNDLVHGSDDTLYDVFISRTFGRFSLDDTDMVIMSSLYHNPREWLTGRGLGLSHIGASAFLSDYYLLQGYYADQIINPKSGITTYAGAGGIVGLLLLSVLFSRLATPATTYGARPASLRQIARIQAVALATFAVLLNRMYSAEVSWVLILVCGLQIQHLSRPSAHPARAPGQASPAHRARPRSRPQPRPDNYRTRNT